MEDVELEMEIGDVVERCLDGDSVAWRDFVETFSVVLRRTSVKYRLSKQETDDICQQTWLTAVEKLPQLRDRSRAGPWLVTIAKREILRHLRSRERCQPTDESLLDTRHREPADVEATVVGRLMCQEMLARLAELPARDQALLTMLLDDTPSSYSAISRRMCLPRGSIGPMRARALARLRGKLDSDGADPGAVPPRVPDPRSHRSA